MILLEHFVVMAGLDPAIHARVAHGF